MDVTQLWAAETALDHAAASQFEPLLHTAGNRFADRGVGPGDRVYVLHVGTRDGFADRRVHLAGRLTVASTGVLTQDAAATALAVEPDELWEAQDHLLAEDGSVLLMDLGRVLPADLLRRLRFVTEARTTALDVDDEGRLNGRQQLRGVRRLAPGSAELLEAFLAAADADVLERRVQWHLDRLQDLLDEIAATPGLERLVGELSAAAEALAGRPPSPPEGEPDAREAWELPLLTDALQAAATRLRDVTSAKAGDVQRFERAAEALLENITDGDTCA